MADNVALVCPLGRVAYRPTWALQEALKNHLVAAKRAGKVVPHLLLLLEHPPVYTLGRSGNAAHLLLNTKALTANGVEFHRIDRGGDITYHGPGQLVGYFLLDLDRIFRDLHRYMRALEDIVIRMLAEYHMPASRVEGCTGVWIGHAGQERKICALGIRSSRWVTMHGIALNLNTDLSYYRHIVPCGIPDRGVTSLALELGHHVNMDTAHRRIVYHFGEVFGLNPTLMSTSAAYTHLETLSGIPGLYDHLQAGHTVARHQQP